MAVALSDPEGQSREMGVFGCVHCGTEVAQSFGVRRQGLVFCCKGCEYVYEIIHSQGLERFYDLRDGPVAPVASGVFQRRHFGWFAELCAKSAGRLEVEIQGISCLACVWLVERVFRGLKGALQIRVDPLRGTVLMRIVPQVFPATEFAELIQRLGYLLGPQSKGTVRVGDRALVRRMAVSGALALNAMLFAVPGYCGLQAVDAYAGVFEFGAVVCAILSMLVGASYFIQRAWASVRLGMVTVDLPIALGLVVAFVGSLLAWRMGDRRGFYFDFISVFTFLMLLGRWLHQAAIEQNRRRLLQAPISVLHPKEGERYGVLPGQVVPVRSELQSSEASLGMEWINGEPEARTESRGGVVPSGAVNLSPETMNLCALEDWDASLLAQLLAIEAKRPADNPSAQRFIKTYLWIVMGVAGLGFVGWLQAGRSFEDAFQVLVSVLVVSCPCASGVALPLSSEVAMARMREFGVFIREEALWDRLLRVRRVAFDKTGTLTGETLQLRNRDELNVLLNGQRDVLIRMVRHSMHPVAVALREALCSAAVSVDATPGSTVREFVGLGLELVDESGVRWRLGRPEWSVECVALQQTEARTVFSCDGRFLSSFKFEERLRQDAAAEVERLRASGMEVVILSGDRVTRVARVAHELGLCNAVAHGEMTPGAKAEWLRARGGVDDTLVLGDGANDAMAFSESLCCGTPAVDRGVLEHRADFYYLGKGLAGIRLLLEMAGRKRKVVVAVLTFAALYNVLAVGVALAGRMHPLLAAVLMPLSSLATLALVFAGFRRGRRAHQ